MHNFIQNLNSLKEENTKIELRTRKNLYDIIARTYGLALACKNDGDCWQDFCREDYFRTRKQKPKFDKPEQALRFVLAYIFGGSSVNRQTLSKYNRALSAAFDANKRYDIVVDILNKEGIEKLAKNNTKKKLTDGSPDTKPKIIYQKEPSYIKKIAKIGIEAEYFVCTYITVTKKDNNTINIRRRGSNITTL